MSYKNQDKECAYLYNELREWLYANFVENTSSLQFENANKFAISFVEYFRSFFMTKMR